MQKLKNRITSLPPAVYIILIMLVGFSSLSEKFFAVKTFENIMNQAATLLVLACGQTIVVLLQGTDLSLGSQISVVSVLWVYLLNMGFPMPVAIILAILSGILMGTVNGFLISKLKIPIFIVTLATSNIYRSVALLLSDGYSLSNPTKFFMFMKTTDFLGLSLVTWVALAAFLLTLFMLKKTRLGIRIKAMGGNIEALRLSGSNSTIQTIKAFAYVGLMAGISGLLLTCRVNSGNPLGGEGYEFNAVAAVLLGGSSLREGNGGVGGTLFGVLMLQMFKTGLQIIGVSSLYQNFLIGVIVIVALVADALIKRSKDI